MKLTVLVDNNTNIGNVLTPEHGLSFYIEDADKKLIFDCGTTDAFIKNAYKIGIDLEHVTDIVLSHSHSDHIGGFSKLQHLYQKFRDIGISFEAKNIIAHPEIFNCSNIEDDTTGEEKICLSRDDIEKFFAINLSKDPIQLTENLYFMGEIPIDMEVKNDYAPDETALVYKSENGLVVMSGCSHSGVQNIIEHAKRVTGESRVNTLIGGIYLINRSGEEINELGRYFKQQHIEKIYPCHCTDLESRIILSRYVNIAEVSTGRSYVWNADTDLLCGV